MTTQVENRLHTIRDIWQSNQGLYVVAGMFIGFLLYPALNIIFADLFGLLENLVPEAIGIVFTVIFIDRLNQRREENRRTRDLQEQLVREAGSQSNGTALSAISELSKQGWLTGDGGLLQGADLRQANLKDANLRVSNLRDVKLSQANLQGAKLHDANLQGVDLWQANLMGVNLQYANLQDARLRGADLQGANLYETNLQGANLWHTNLQGAILTRANLQEANLLKAKLLGANLLEPNLQDANLLEANLLDANLWNANLQGTNLWNANLQGTNLDNATFNDQTTIPDGTTWTPDTDMTCFTDPKHPNFWRSDWWGSPAYKGDDNDEADN